MMAKKRFVMTIRTRERLQGMLFVLPWFCGFMLFFVRNMYETLIFSLNKITPHLGHYDSDFVAFENYIYAFRGHAQFLQVLYNSMSNLLIDVPMIIFFALFMALILNRKFKGRGVIRALFFLPVIIATDGVTLMLNMANAVMAGGIQNLPSEFMSTTEGMNVMGLMRMLSNYGIPANVLGYVADVTGRIYTIMRASGVQIVIFIAALQSVSPAMYEVAHIEGATPYETFWKITLPMISPLIITNVVYTIVDNYTVSPVVELAKNTGTSGSYDFGLSAAMSMSSAVCVGLILFAVVWLLSRFTFYQNA
ncbi:MAG: sugar ABC transporter permease [Defluviitaleaceae bacterium]|nr:sugar ABC transporter permease [Defluviitaleaceae bacterium]